MHPASKITVTLRSSGQGMFTMCENRLCDGASRHACMKRSLISDKKIFTPGQVPRKECGIAVEESQDETGNLAFPRLSRMSNTADDSLFVEEESLILWRRSVTILKEDARNENVLLQCAERARSADRYHGSAMIWSIGREVRAERVTTPPLLRAFSLGWTIARGAEDLTPSTLEPSGFEEDMSSENRRCLAWPHDQAERVIMPRLQSEPTQSCYCHFDIEVE